jgi:hypothetical protein
MIAVTVAIVIAGAPAFAAETGDFCAGLKSAAAETGNGFETLRGAQISVQQGSGGLTYTNYTYAATSDLAGSIPSSCQVVTTIDGGKTSGVYRCLFEYGGPKRLAKLESLAVAVAHCIGPTTDDNVNFYPDDDTGGVDFIRPTFEVQLSASDSQPLVLLISKPLP